MIKRKPTVVSLYSGAGGIDIGFEKAGFEIILSTDNWDIACQTLRENGISGEVICSDIRNINFKRFKGADVLVGGPPCPPFSKSRFYRTEKKRGMEDENGFTVTEYFRAVEEIKPSIFFFENVHGFVYRPHIEALNYLKQRSDSLGYEIKYDVVNAADFGVPQTRERFICVGVKKSLPKFNYPRPTHGDPLSANGLEIGVLPWITCGEVLSDIDFNLPEDEKMQAGSKHKDLLKLVPPGDNYLFFTQERGHSNPIFKWRSRYWSFLLKLSPSRPSWTIQASHSNNMGPFHWKNRFLRIPEIKRIQTFGDDYKLIGSFKDQWRQVGNAVPPLLARIFAESIMNQYFVLPTNNKPTSYVETSLA